MYSPSRIAARYAETMIKRRKMMSLAAGAASVAAALLSADGFASVLASKMSEELLSAAVPPTDMLAAADWTLLGAVMQSPPF